MAPMPCPSSEMLQELPSHVVFAWVFACGMARLGRSDKWEKSTLCHLTVKEMEAQSCQGMATEDGEVD